MIKKIASLIKGAIQYWPAYYFILQGLVKLTPFNWDDKAIKLINKRITKGLDVKGVEDWVKVSIAKKLDTEAKKIGNVGVSYDPKTKKIGVSLKHDNLSAAVIGDSFKLGLKF